MPKMAVQPNPREIMLAVIYFSASSIGMMTGNKVATNHLPLPSTLIILQAIATCIPLATNAEVLGLQKKLCVKWVPVTVLFAAMLFTSMQSFLYCTVSTILVFRNVATICSTVVEYLVRCLCAKFFDDTPHPVMILHQFCREFIEGDLLN